MTTRSTPKSFELVIPSDSEFLGLLRSCVKWFCEQADFSEQETSRTVLCVVEAVTNIIRYAYDGEPGETIQLRCRELTADADEREGVELELVDAGRSIPPCEIEEACSEGDEHGGRGLFLMKTCMDRVRYEERPCGGARLVLTKFREE